MTPIDIPVSFEMDRPSSDAATLTLIFDHATGLITMTFVGEVTYADLQSANRRLAHAGQGEQVRGILIDARQSSGTYSPAELVSIIETACAHTAPPRCAMLTATPREQLIMLVETVAFPRGIKVRRFEDSADAYAWAAGA